MSINEGPRTVPPVALLGTYVPRKCGIGTFTHDLATALAGHAGTPLSENGPVRVLAMNNDDQRYAYSSEVFFELRDQQQPDYREAAEFLNNAPIDVVCVQHEYGIYGGPDGNYLLRLLRHVNKPVITTLHTVLQEPSEGQRRTLQAICARSSYVVVMAERAYSMLQSVYGVPAQKIVYIPHGVPDVPFLDPEFNKDKYNVAGRRVLLTFGLLSPNKGIEVALEAVAQLVEEYPDLAYIVLGATHPAVVAQQGEEYRHSLERRAVELGIEKNVFFHNQYVSFDELCDYLVAADLYVTPYWSREQIVSGTLSYALGCGKAIVSTPYWYAEELLANGRGVLTPFGDSSAMADRLRKLLRDDAGRSQMRKRAYMHGRHMVWSEVAARYSEVFARSITEYADRRLADGLTGKTQAATQPYTLPPVNLQHLHTLTDDTGMLQHAVFATPDRNHGYCIDDNARALIAVLQHWRLTRNVNVLPLYQRYLSFVHHAYNAETGMFRNFMAYNRTWLESEGSPDSQGRTIWALGEAVAFAPNNAAAGLAATLFRKALPIVRRLESPRAQAFALLGLHAYLRRFSGASEVRRERERLALALYSRFEQNASENWPWCEETATYCNARIPQALIMSGQWLNHNAMLEQGLRSLEWLCDRQTNPTTGGISIIGNNGWMQRDSTARFDQQPVDAGALVEATAEAYRVTGEPRWRDQAQRSLGWFMGENDLQLSLIDSATGGCYDALHSTGVNANQGAESVLAWLMALQALHLLQSGEALPALSIADLRIDEQRPVERRGKSLNSITGD